MLIVGLAWFGAVVLGNLGCDKRSPNRLDGVGPRLTSAGVPGKYLP